MRTRSASTCAVLWIAALLTTAARAEQVDNPYYQAWAACKPGTTLTVRESGASTSIEVGADGGMTETPIVLSVRRRLVEILPDMVVIGDSVLSRKGRETLSTIPARIDKRLLAMPPGFRLPASAKIADVQDGRETIDVGGKAIETTTHAVTLQSQGASRSATIHARTWSSSEVPGGMAKSEVLVEGLTVSPTGKTFPRVETVLDFTKSAVAVPRPAEDLDDRTPLGLLRMTDRAPTDGGIEKWRASYHADSADGKAFADQGAALDLSMAKLKEAVRGRFGKATSETAEVDHIIGDGGCSRGEIESAEVELQGNSATVANRGQENGVELLIKVGGHWKYDADTSVAGPPEQVKLELQFVRDSTAFSDRLTKELGEGKYKTEEELTKVMTEEMDKIKPAALKAPPATAP